MSVLADELAGLLDLEPIEYNIYRGQNRDIGSGRIYGGQVLAQSLVAAQRTVEEDRPVHSMHGYFILAGDLSIPVVYFVDRLRDGRSFTTRRVTAIQHGHAIFNMSASFHRREEGLSHQVEMPEAPDPETLRPELEIIRERAGEIGDERLRRLLTRDRLLDIRRVGDEDPFDDAVGPPRRLCWVRSTVPLSDDPLQHRALLAFASDYGLLVTALRPHGIGFRDPRMMVASLDHSIWFHRQVRMDDWLLYEVESPISCGARGFARGTYFARDGRVVASVAQEGLIRLKDPQADR